MSRHYYDAEIEGRAVRVTLGYDRPLDAFFMTVAYLDAPAAASDDEDASSLLYSNLDDSEPFPQTLAQYRRRLAVLGVRLPESVWHAVEEDGLNRVGNREVWHTTRADDPTIGKVAGAKP